MRVDEQRPFSTAMEQAGQLMRLDSDVRSSASLEQLLLENKVPPTPDSGNRKSQKYLNGIKSDVQVVETDNTHISINARAANTDTIHNVREANVSEVTIK